MPSYYSASYIICHAATSEYRTRNLNTLIMFIRKNFSNVEIIVAEQGPSKSNIEGIDQHIFIEDYGLFRRAELINKAVLLSNSDKLILGDNDVILDVSSYHETLKCLEVIQAVNPYNNILDMPLEDTNNFIEHLNGFVASKGSSRGGTVFGGGVVGIRRKDFCRIGGYDESFIGWGGEDNAFTHKILTLCTNKTLNYRAYHLWHDRNINGTSNHEHYLKNIDNMNAIMSMGFNELVAYCADIRKQFEPLYPDGLFDTPRIGIVTRSMNDELYNKMKSLLNLDFTFIRHTTYHGTYEAAKYIYDVVLDDRFDWIINIDEDFFTYDSNSIMSLLTHMIDNGIDYCGMSDGGMCIHRFHSPIVMNPFFNIFNSKKIREALDDIRYVENTFKYNDSMMRYMPSKIKDNFPWVNDNFEPFYPFFYWLPCRGFKSLYLESYELAEDNISTILKNHEGVEMGIHTWFTREYGRDVKHTNRINRAFEIATNKKKEKSNVKKTR